MAQVLHPEQIIHVSKSLHQSTFFRRFADWTGDQEKRFHIGWVGISVGASAGVLFPLTMAFVLFNGASFALIIAAMAALVAVVIANLAAMSAKFTIPLLLGAAVVDIIIAVLSFVH